MGSDDQDPTLIAREHAVQLAEAFLHFSAQLAAIARTLFLAPHAIAVASDAGGIVPAAHFCWTVMRSASLQSPSQRSSGTSSPSPTPLVVTIDLRPGGGYQFLHG